MIGTVSQNKQFIWGITELVQLINERTELVINILQQPMN